MVRQSKKVIASRYYEEHLTEIIEYSIETFGYIQAKKYFGTILNCVENLNRNYTYYPECRHLATKSHRYRNIILDAHLIIYHVTDERIEVLDIIPKCPLAAHNIH
jgi:plasmid stabilization system protein ParE